MTSRDLHEAVASAWAVLEALTDRPQWFLAFSGGKDSTAVLVLAVEFLRHRRPPIALSVLYADTRLEIPPMARHAARLLAHVEALTAAEGLPVRVFRVRSPIAESFWTLMLGKGYPPPGFRFRWCTDRLKVRPMNRLADGLASDPKAAVMLVGVREGESGERDRRLAAACGRGECGPAAVGRASRFPAVSPIRSWRTCTVWDFLTLLAPRWGWPTEELRALYGEDERVRYGCWVCPLVRKDRAMAAAIAAADGERPALEALAAFRERLLAIGRSPESRVRKPDGRPGPLRMEVRRMLFQELLDLQETTGLPLIAPEEVEEIRARWEQEEASHGGA